MLRCLVYMYTVYRTIYIYIIWSSANAYVRQKFLPAYPTRYQCIWTGPCLSMLFRISRGLSALDLEATCSTCSQHVVECFSIFSVLLLSLYPWTLAVAVYFPEPEDSTIVHGSFACRCCLTSYSILTHSSEETGLDFVLDISLCSC